MRIRKNVRDRDRKRKTEGERKTERERQRQKDRDRKIETERQRHSSEIKLRIESTESVSNNHFKVTVFLLADKEQYAPCNKRVHRLLLSFFTEQKETKTLLE